MGDCAMGFIKISPTQNTLELAPGLIGLNRRRRFGPARIGPPDIHDEADQHERCRSELVKRRVECHNEGLLHVDERDSFDRMDSLWHDPLAGDPRPNGGRRLPFELQMNALCLLTDRGLPACK